jgi:citrate lyase beta subunit
MIARMLPPDVLRPLMEKLSAAHERVQQRFPGESGRRQPVHVMYGGAHLFRADTAPRLGVAALRALDEYAGDAARLGEAVGLPPALATTIYGRVREKLEREPIEDYRLDFEDGYGNRPDAEEDGHAAGAAREVAGALAGGQAPPYLGIRIKPLSEDLRDRAVRTLDVFISELMAASQGRLPDAFVVTLPKITSAVQVSVLAGVFDRLEQAHRLATGSLRMELMIETTQSIVDERGGCSLPALVAAGGDRITGAHFGTYDYTAACGITAAHQHMRHAACDFARNVMQVALAGTGIWLSDGATNILPVPVHRARDGAELSDTERAVNRAAVHRAWRLHYQDVQHSLASGFYQGWDLHPAQLVTRYAAVHAFFLQNLDAASERLRNFLAKAAQATLVGEVFDDAATGQGLLNYFLRAMNCGAVREEEIERLSGLTVDELRTASFVKIVERRRQPGRSGPPGAA